MRDRRQTWPREFHKFVFTIGTEENLVWFQPRERPDPETANPAMAVKPWPEADSVRFG
jgi:hypothetical protein